MWHYLQWVIMWCYLMETFSILLALCPLTSLVDSLYKGQVMQSFAIFCLLALISYFDVPWICLYGTIFIIGYQKTISTLRCCLATIGIPIVKTRWTHDHLIFMMEIPISGKTIFYIQTWPAYVNHSFLPVGHVQIGWADVWNQRLILMA